MTRRLVLAGDSHLALLTGRPRWALRSGLPGWRARIVIVDPPGVGAGPAVRGRDNATIDVYRALLIDALAGPGTTVLGARGLVDTSTGAGLRADGLHLDRRANRRLVAQVVGSLR